MFLQHFGTGFAHDLMIGLQHLVGAVQGQIRTDAVELSERSR